MKKNNSWMPHVSRWIGRQEQLSVDHQTVGCRENYLLRHHHLRSRKIGWNGFRGKNLRRAGRGHNRRKQAVLRIRTQRDHSFPIAVDHGVGVEPFSGSQLRRRATMDRNFPNMSSINIILIRGVDHFLSIRTYRRFEDLKISGCEKFWPSVTCGNAIQMKPACALPGEHNAVISAPEQLAFSRNFMKQAPRPFVCLPYSMASTVGRIRNPDGPGLAAALPKEIVRLVCGNANKGNLFAVERPFRIDILVHTRTQPTDRLFT